MSDAENKAEQLSDWVEVGASTFEQTEEDVEQVEEHEQHEAEQEEASDELELVIDGEAVPPTAEDDDDVPMPDDAPNWARELRQKYKELAKENKQLKQSVPQVEPEKPVAVQPMQKPTLELCGWDENVFASKMDEYAENQIALKLQAQQAEAEKQKQQDELSGLQRKYTERRSAVMKQAADYESAEAGFVGAIGEQAQLLVLKYAKDPAAVVLAAGRNKALLQELQQIQHDPLALAAKIGELNRTATFAPKTKPQFKAEPSVKAQSSKPPSAADARFNSMFPDAKFS